MDIIEEAIEYFRSNKGYFRLLRGIRNKYISLGEMKGNVHIVNPTIEERQALSGLMKKDFSKNNTISININKLQCQLQNTRFSTVDSKELISKYFAEEIITNKEINKKSVEELENFFNNILEKNKETFVYNYLNEILQTKNNIYKTLKKYYKSDKSLLEQSLLNACKGINNLPNQNVRIPVFASKIVNNPHAYDKKNLCGKIFIMLLSYINNVSIPENSEELAELYYKNHLLVDDISNMVLCRNILGYVKDEIDTKYIEHAGLQGFEKYNEPIYLTIYNLSNISFINKYNSYKKVLITENPSVFMEITEKCKRRNFPLVCTYGQIKLAGIILLDLLVESGFILYYSGDIDPEGIQIADKLKQRYVNSLKFIGFDVETYLKNISNIKLSEVRINKLKHVKSKELIEVCQALDKNKRAAYEEENILNLIEFVDSI